MMPLIALTLLGAAAFVLAIRLVIGPSLGDRVVALDGLLIVAISILIVDAARTGRTAFLDIAVVVGILGFVGTGIAAHFIERRGA